MDIEFPEKEALENNGKGRSLVIWACLFFVCVPLFMFLWFWHFAVTPGPQANGQSIEVVIPERTGLQQICMILEQKGVVGGALRLRVLAAVTGTGRHLQAGEYVFQAGQTPMQVLEMLVKGKVHLYPVIIPEGADLAQVAYILSQGGWVEKEEFLQLTRNRIFIKGLGLDVETLDGYLSPDTYMLSRGQQNATHIVSLMVKHTLAVFADLQKEFGAGGLTRHEVLTLASIVEKETGLDAERPIIARVFLNRLARGMRLQADPTVLYGRAGGDRQISKKDLQTSSSYNTYIIPGLPPGPIGSPGRAAIAAVLNPAEAPYLYFVAKGDGTHVFSSTLDEHNQAVKKYR